ncbi:MAG: EamA family transporter [Planctomycetes bacterium]|nr:EamA family transporter [Planctomycetota bacterium]
MSIGNAAWFAIVGLLPPDVAGLSAILVPVVAMVAGAVVHAEPLGPPQWLAIVCCVGSLWLVVRVPRAATGSADAV